MYPWEFGLLFHLVIHFCQSDFFTCSHWTLGVRERCIIPGSFSQGVYYLASAIIQLFESNNTKNMWYFFISEKMWYQPVNAFWLYGCAQSAENSTETTQWK